MRSGRLRHRVTLRRPVQSRNANNHQVVSYETLGVRKAGIEHISGRETQSSGGERALATSRIRMRYDSLTCGLLESDEIVHGSVVYDIQHINNVEERNRELVILCRSR